jgi:hypothetical protein
MVRSAALRPLALMLCALLVALLFASPVQAQDTVVDLTVTSVTLDATGTLIVAGVVTCAEPAEAFVRADASQQIGRVLVFGSGEAPDIVACNPTGTTVIVPIVPQVGSFRPGPANIVDYAFICAPDFFICSSNGFDTVDGTFRVRRTS